MLRAFSLTFLAGLMSTLAASASPEKPGAEHRPGPAGTVVARVNVNVETEVDVSHGPAAGKSESEDADDDQDSPRKDGARADLSELVGAVLKQSAPGSGVQIITDININVETSIKVRRPGSAPGEPKAPALKSPPKPADEAKPDTKPEQPASEAPRKKRRKKRAQSSAETSTAPQAEGGQARFGLNRLKLGETLELGVSGEMESEQRAQQVAQRINVGKNQALLGMGFVGMLLPEEADALKVVQQAVSSVQADASGNELSVSAAIPRETPGAVKTLVKAALKKE